MSNKLNEAMPQGAEYSRPDRRLKSLAVFIELEKRIRGAENQQALFFLMVNETHTLTPYRQAVLWKSDDGSKGSIAAVSGLAAPEPNAPFSVWISAVAQHLGAQADARQPRQIQAAEIPDKLRVDWDKWLPASLLWLPIPSREQDQGGALLLARDKPWQDAERKLLEYFADACSHAWGSLLRRKRRWWHWSPARLRLRWALAAVVLLLGLIPVHQTALAPAEIIPLDPVLVRAPIDGVVQDVLVEPNQAVSAGQILLTLDNTRLANRLEVARKALEVAQAEYRQNAQQGLSDNRANAGLAMLKGRVEQHQVEVAYLRDMLDRTTVRAPRGGIAIFDDVNQWLGTPVTIGERIMLVADPAETELEVRLPVADAITLDPGSRVRLFLNIDPHDPLEATLRYASYEATLTPENILAYRLVASFPAGALPRRIGLRGSAKLYGERTVLAMYLLRRPLQALRQAVGI